MALSVELHKKFKGFQMDVAFEHDGGSLGILGGSGIGKSMTLKMIAGLVKPDSGKVGMRRRKKLTDFLNSLPFRTLADVCRMNYPAVSSSG